MCPPRHAGSARSGRALDPTVRRLGVLAALALGAMLLVPVARADTKSELTAAKERLQEIDDQVASDQAALDELTTQIDAQANEVSRAEGEVEQVRAQIADTQGRLRQARHRLQQVRQRLNERAVELYMQGPPGGINIVIGAGSMADLTDRLMFADAVAASDADLGNQVQNLSNELGYRLSEQERLLGEQSAALARLRDQLGQLRDRWSQQRTLTADIEAKRREAERLVASLQKRYQQELAQQIPPSPSTGTSTTVAGGTLQTCPVGSPRAVSDGFGAPRYGGGYHLHMGNDIMAPSGTPIYATFPGTVYDVSNSLGGIAVKVVGTQGWTYNAHMSRIAQLGSVSAGEVIGYVGATGDTSTPHDHFEWHPNVLPVSWPASPYGYNVIDDAVNPYPLLATVC